mgnify:CR=1 FL=1
MGKAKPTLGYPTRAAACVALHAQGLKHGEIGQKLGIAKGTVCALIASQKGRRAEDFYQRTVRVDETVLSELKPHAKKRGLRVHQLVRELVHCVVQEGLVDAILDDG